jgi:hypothetical protein
VASKCSMRKASHKRPALRPKPHLHGILFHITDRATDVPMRIEKHRPTLPRPWRRRWPHVAKRVALLRSERLSRPRFEMAGDALWVARVPRSHEVSVIRKDGARIDGIFRFRDGRCEARRDRNGLLAIEANWRMLQSTFASATHLRVMGKARHRSALINRRSLACREQQFPRSYEFGPGTARIVWQPEAVGGENDVAGDDHLFFNAVGRAPQAEPLKFLPHRCMISSSRGNPPSPQPRIARIRDVGKHEPPFQ